MNPPPDPKDLYPDPTKETAKSYEKQEKFKAWHTVRTIIFAITILGVFAVGGYWIYTNKIVNKINSSVTNQVNDETVKTDLARVKTLSSYYYKTYKSFEGMDNDSDMKAMAETIANHGSILQIQGLSNTTFVAYVILPTSKEYYCTDAANYLGKTGPIASDQSTCL